MGFAISWCAVPESAADEFLHGLGLTDTGETEEIPESLIGVANLDTGWRLLWYNEYDCPFLGEVQRREISLSHDLLYCLVEEHCMASSSEMWSGGSRNWWISHEGIDGPKGLDSSGDLPTVFPQIRSEMEAQQLAEGGETADVDYIFEIPLLVAKSITGFKHDEVCPHVIGNEFKIMRKESRPGGLLSRFFANRIVQPLPAALFR
jgi:hypothetical protein